MGGPFAGVDPPPGAPAVRIRDLDFYAFRDDRISYNWCMVDVVDIFHQVGYRLLPESPLPDGLDGYGPPRSTDGVPAPDSFFVSAAHADVAADIFLRMIDEDYVSQTASAK